MMQSSRCVFVCERDKMIVRLMWLVAQMCVQLCEAKWAGEGLWGDLSDDWMRMDRQVFGSKEGFWCHPDKLEQEV